MTSHQQKRLNRQIEISQVLKINAGKLQSLPYYGGIMAEMDHNLEALLGMYVRHHSQISGATVAKGTARQKLEEHILDVANAIAAYAFFEDKTELLQKTSFNDSDLDKCPQQKLVSIGNDIYKLALSLHDEMNAYGLPESEVESLAAALDAYLAIMHKPKMHKADYEFATKRINELFRESSLLLKKSDRMVKVVRFREPALYSEYRSLRRWVKTGYRHIALKGQAVDALSGRGLQGVSFRFRPADEKTRLVVNGKTLKEAEHISSVRGGFMVKRLPEGTYECTATRTGYIPQTIKVFVNKGILVRMRVEMERE